MSRRLPWLLGFLVVGLGAAAVPAVPQGGGAKDGAAAAQTATDDYQDLVYLGESRPVVMRLHAQLNGKPFSAVWQDWVKKLFQHFDRDGDGVLSPAEAVRAPKAEFLRQQLQGDASAPDEANVGRLSEYGPDVKDGPLTLAQFTAYYRRAGFGPLRVVLAPEQEAGEALTEVLFRHLDGDKDGKLSREELAAAATVLQKLDYDDDEMISVEELAPSNAPAGPRRAPRPGRGREVRSGEASFLAVAPGASPLELTRALLERYDRDRNRRLTRAEIGLDAASFKQLDADGNGELDADELAKFLRRAPDFEVLVRLRPPAPRRPPAAAALVLGGAFIALPRGAEGDRGLTLLSAGGKAAPPAGLVRQLGGEDLAITLSDGVLDLARGQASSNAFQQSRQLYLAQFRAADRDKRGFVERKQLRGDEAQVLLSLFPFADRDGDGKLTEKELQAYLALLAEGANCFTVVRIADRGRSLFEALDANGDGRLSVRELRTAWARLGPWDRDGDGCLARAEVPRRYQVVLGAGEAAAGAPPPARRAPAPSGPLWFRKMDRNGDGDVSPREFLGTPEEFRRIDTDGDGLIDADEATRADEWFRKRLARMP
jgi:Ca2+-binding EF-hand superfamily protein